MRNLRDGFNMLQDDEFVGDNELPFLGDVRNKTSEAVKKNGVAEREATRLAKEKVLAEKRREKYMESVQKAQNISRHCTTCGEMMLHDGQCELEFMRQRRCVKCVSEKRSMRDAGGKYCINCGRFFSLLTLQAKCSSEKAVASWSCCCHKV